VLTEELGKVLSQNLRQN